MKSLACVFVAVPLAFVACKKAETQPAPAASMAPAVATTAAVAAPAPTPDPMAAAAAAAAAAPAAGDLPTPEDFEQQALDDINPQNLETELNTLETQIGK